MTSTPSDLVPAAAANDPALPPLAADWQDWLTSSIVAGMPDAELLATMCKSGFEPAYSRVAISIVRSMAERVRQQNPSMLTGYAADPIRLPSGAKARVADREVRLPIVLADPNVALIENLLSEQECEKLIQLSRGKLRGSQVVDPISGQLEESGVRRSEGTHFGYAENAIVQRIEQRVAALTGIPVPHGEPLQILHYPVGGEYIPHHDYFDPNFPGTAKLLAHGGQRVASLVMYLNEPEGGGDTWFPELELSVRPRKGSGVYFEYFNSKGELDTRLLHAGTPVTRGEKWIATKWLRQSPYHS